MSERMEELLVGHRLPRNKNEKAWAKYHNKYPGAYELFDKYSRELLAKGIKQIGPHTIEERIRWFSLVEATSTSFRFTANFTAYYTRLWLERNTRHPTFFATKPVRVTLPQLEMAA